MSVRAKFKCNSVTHFENEQVEVRLTPVYGDGENAEWSKHTPSGDLRMSITNPPAAAMFRPGAVYFLDIVEA